MKFKHSCYVPQGLVACHGFDMTVAIVKDRKCCGHGMSVKSQGEMVGMALILSTVGLLQV